MSADNSKRKSEKSLCSSKRSRRSSEKAFNFQSDCFYCGQECKPPDPKNPKRHKQWFRVRTLMGQNVSKESILQLCGLRDDEQAHDVSIRLNSTISDLHAVDARYHKQCKTTFHVSKKAKKYATHEPDVGCVVDEHLNNIFEIMEGDKTVIWNSVQLFNLYEQNGGHMIVDRRTLLKHIIKNFGDSLVTLSSDGVATLLLFNEQCRLINVEYLKDNDRSSIDKSITEIAKSIRNDTERTDRLRYKIKFDCESIIEGYSKTLMLLLEELNIGKLPSMVIGSIVTASVTKQRTDLQVAFSNFLRQKKIIESLAPFGITTNFTEFDLFKGSAALHATEKGIQLQSTKSNVSLKQGVGDNFDSQVYTQNGLKQNHNMALIFTEEKDSNSYLDMYINRKTKEELKTFRTPSYDIRRYRGPLNPPMPEEEAKFNVPSLKFLCRQSLSVQRAKENDFLYLKSIIDESKPEWSGFNTAVTRDSGYSLQPATNVTYLPLLKMKPSDPDTALTSMHIIKDLTEQCGQGYTIYTNDQQLYRITTQITWWDPKSWETFVPILGGMHTLMSFIGAVGVLMANTGLKELMESAFGAVETMLKGKNFPQNVRALRMCTVEVLRSVLEDDDMQDPDLLNNRLTSITESSRTSKLWCDGLIKPVFIMMMFVRAAREADWSLHLKSVELMLPYFAAAAHWNYLRYATVYYLKMSRLPYDAHSRFMKGEHAMRHQVGLWNSIWSDMMIETTVMRYGHGPNGMKGLIFHEKALERWAYSLHISTQLEHSLLNLKETATTSDVTHHKEESQGRIRSDNEDRRKIREKLETFIHPLHIEDHPHDIVNIYSGKLSTDEVNVDDCVRVGKRMLFNFRETLPGGFYKALKQQVKTMSVIGKGKTQRINDGQIDTSLIYSRVIALQMTNAALSMDEVLKYELAPIPTSMFKETGNLRICKTKSDLKAIASYVPQVSSDEVDAVIIDGCAILRHVHWPDNAKVIDYINNFTSYVEQNLIRSNVNLIFDRYFDFSIKSATRIERGKNSCRKHKLLPSSPLPSISTVLDSIHNKTQLIDLICSHLITHATKTVYKNRLVVTGSSRLPLQVKNGLLTERDDLDTTQEEADIIVVQQAYHQVIDEEANSVKIVCDDTDVFALLVYFFWKLNITSRILMEETGVEKKTIDVGKTVSKNESIVARLVAAHALTGCDTVAQYFHIGKNTMLAKLKEGYDLGLLGILDSPITSVIEQAASFISCCYGFPGKSMTEARILSWCKKTATARKSAPELKFLPPTNESFAENVKRAHIQTAIWYSTMDQHPPQFEPSMYGWSPDHKNKILVAVGIPDGIKACPEAILKTIKCICKSEKACSSKQCGCYKTNMSCSKLCKCRGDEDVCHNTSTK